MKYAYKKNYFDAVYWTASFEKLVREYGILLFRIDMRSLYVHYDIEFYLHVFEAARFLMIKVYHFGPQLQFMCL